MESQPQNPEFRNNPENFHPCKNQKLVHWPICCGLRKNEIRIIFLFDLILYVPVQTGLPGLNQY